MDTGTLEGIGTIFALLAILAVFWWAFSKHKKKDFEEASLLPFADDDDADRQTNSSKKHQ